MEKGLSVLEVCSWVTTASSAHSKVTATYGKIDVKTLLPLHPEETRDCVCSRTDKRRERGASRELRGQLLHRLWWSHHPQDRRGTLAVAKP